MEHVIKSEKEEVDKIIRLKSQEVQDVQLEQPEPIAPPGPSSLQEKVEQVKREAIKASDAQFVRTPQILFFDSLTSCQVKKLLRTESMKAEEKRMRRMRVRQLSFLRKKKLIISISANEWCGWCQYWQRLT